MLQKFFYNILLIKMLGILCFKEITLIGISVSTQEIPSMIMPRSFSAVVGSDYTVFLIGKPSVSYPLAV